MVKVGAGITCKVANIVITVPWATDRLVSSSLSYEAVTRPNLSTARANLGDLTCRDRLRQIQLDGRRTFED